MWDWLKDNVDTLQVLVSLLSTGVWIAYLHVFLSNYRRQFRSSLLISRAGAQTFDGRCLISNMGAEPAFLTDVLAEFSDGGRCRTLSVVDRLELWEQSECPRQGMSAEGPIASGSYVDIGSFRDILKRAKTKTGSPEMHGQFDDLTLVAIAATNQARDLVAARRSFRIEWGRDGAPDRLRPAEVEARQIRSQRKRSKLKSILQELQTRDVVDRPVSGELS